MKEAQVFSGDSFKYPAFITAFDSIIANKVHTDKDQLFFLEKYTDRSANEEIKGSLATNSDIAYNQQTIGAALWEPYGGSRKLQVKFTELAKFKRWWFQRASRVFWFFGMLSGSDENFEVDGWAWF